MKRKKGAFTDSGGGNPQGNSGGRSGKKKGIFPRLLLGIWLVALTVLLIILYTNMPQGRPPVPPKTVLVKKIDKMQEDLARAHKNQVTVVRPTEGEAPDPGDLLSFNARLNRMEGRMAVMDRIDERLARLDEGYHTLENLIGRLDRLESAVAAAAPVLGLSPSQVEDLTAARTARGRTGTAGTGTGQAAEMQEPFSRPETASGREEAEPSGRPVGDLAAALPGPEGETSPGDRMRDLRERAPGQRPARDADRERGTDAQAAPSDRPSRETRAGAETEGTRERGVTTPGATARRETGRESPEMASAGTGPGREGIGERGVTTPGATARRETGRESPEMASAGTGPGREGIGERGVTTPGTRVRRETGRESPEMASAGTGPGREGIRESADGAGKAAAERVIASREAYIQNRLQRLKRSPAPGGEGPRQPARGTRSERQRETGTDVDKAISDREAYIRNRLSQRDHQEALRFPSDYRPNPLGSSLHGMSQRFTSIYLTPGERKERNQAAPGITMFPQRELGKQ